MVSFKLKLFCLIASMLAFVVGCASDIRVTDPRTGIEYVVPSSYSNLPGIRKFAGLCATNYGTNLLSIKHVDGYYDETQVNCGNTCWISFADSKFNFLEVPNTGTKDVGGTTSLAILKLEKTKDFSQCNPTISKFFLSRQSYRAALRGSCISASEKSYPSSKYGYYHSNDWLSDQEIPEGSQVLVRKWSVMDIGKQMEIASRIHYALYPNKNSLNPSETLTCSDLGMPKIKSTLLEETLKPEQ